MDNQTDHQKMMSMKEMIAEKSRKNLRDKIIEKNRNSNPFVDSKKFIQPAATQAQKMDMSDLTLNRQLNDQILQQIQQFEQDIPLEQEEIGHFQILTLNSFKFRMGKITAANINSEDTIKLMENIPEFFKENKSENLIRKFQEDGALDILLNMMRNLETLKPISYQIARIIEIIAIFAQVEEFINKIWITNESINVFLNLCVENQDQQILEQLFQLLGFLCSDSGIERRDYIRGTPLISYLCKQIDKYQMNQYFFASIIVRNGIWLLVSLCSDLPEEGNFDYCKDAIHIFVRFLKCHSGTVSQECTWVLDTLVQYYISPKNPNQQENINYFISIDLPTNLTETFKLNCLTTSQSSIKILKQMLEYSSTKEQKCLIANDIVIGKIIDLLKVQQRLLVFKLVFEFIGILTQSSDLIQVLLKNQFLPHLFKEIKNPDQKFNSLAIKPLLNIIQNALDEQLIEIVNQGLFATLKELLDQSKDQVITTVICLQMIEEILEAGDVIYQEQQQNKFLIFMDQSGLLQNIDDLQLSPKEALSEKAIQIIERFCLKKGERIIEETD